MDNLTFAPVRIEDIDRLYRYTSVYGEGSCQHSPVSMWSLWEKYGDEYCEKDGFLIIHRSHLSDEKYRVYLAPMCEKRPDAYQAILDDAHSYGKKVRFITLTKGNAEFLSETFPQRFDLKYERDLAEYIIEARTFLQFPGKFHARRRTEIRTFWKNYGERTSAAVMTAEDIEEMRAYAREWLEANAESHDENVLNKEMKCINKQLDYFEQLGLTGTVIRIDGAIRGFCYGVALNDNYYDVLIEKGDRAFPGLYRVIRQESTRLNVSGFQYVNFEEDVGVEGLRKVKESYGPAFLIEKYIATER